MIPNKRQTIKTIVAAAIFAVGASILIAPARAAAGAVYLDTLKSDPALSQDNLSSSPSLQGTSYDHAVTGPDVPGAAQSPSTDWRISYKLNGNYIRLRAMAGVADMLGAQAAADFTVVGDGRTLFSTQSPQRSGDAPINLDIDVTGVQVLTLEISSDGTDPFPKTVVWGDPMLYPIGAVVPAPPSWPPVQTGQSNQTVDNTGSGEDQSPVQNAPSMPPSAEPTPDQSAPEAPNSSTPDSGGYSPPAPVPGLNSSAILIVPLSGQFTDFPHVADYLTGDIGDQLGSDAGMSIVPEDQASNMLGGAYGYLSPSQIRAAGRAAGARYVVMGRIEICRIDDSNLNLYVASGVNTQAVIKFDAELADASTGLVVKRDSEQVTAKTVHIKGFDFGADDDTLINDALRYAAQKFADAVTPVLEPEPAASSI